VDAASRAKALLEQGAPTEELVRCLRADGFSAIQSMSALITVAGLTLSGATVAVRDSPTWADERDRFTTNKWIDPPQPPDEAALERLRATCREESWIVEAWVTGQRITGMDGSVEESTGIALVLEPALSERPDEEESRRRAELVAKLDAAAPQVSGSRSWLFVSESIIAACAKHSLKIYTRGQ
jgi:hypothetical protein